MRRSEHAMRAARAVRWGRQLGVSLLTTACAVQGGLDAGGAGGRSSTRPIVRPQFAPVPDASWTIAQPVVGQVLPCRKGKVLVFDCHNVDLVSFLPTSVIGGGRLSGIWGWTDAQSGREFALVARESGTSFVELTDPVNPRYLGELPMHAGSKPTEWREVKVYQHYAYVVADGDAGPHGMQVFDLQQLLTVASAPAVFTETAHYDKVSNVHNLAIDTASGFAYLVGGNSGGETCGGGLHIVDLHVPTRPTFVGCYPETLGGQTTGYVHDAQCVVYHGPDRRYRGHELCLNAAVKALGIVDVTDKPHPQSIGVGAYPAVGYAHQGWFTEDQRYFFLDDEIDEMLNRPTRTIVFDLADLTEPVVATEYFATTYANDHNLYVRGRYVYETNYKAGLRVLDAADPVHPQEVGYFDTTPNDEGRGLAGTWSNYPYFRSGMVAASSIGEGLFVLCYHPAKAHEAP